MERIQVLIEKLAEQSKRGECPAQLLITVQLLQQELMLAQQNSRQVGSAKVAVVMPSRPTYQEAQPVFESMPLQEDQAAKRPEPVPDELQGFLGRDVHERAAHDPAFMLQPGCGDAHQYSARHDDSAAHRLSGSRGFVPSYRISICCA